MNPDELLAHDLEAFFKHYMENGMINTNEGLAIATAFVVVNKVIKQEGTANENTLLSVLGHGRNSNPTRIDSQPVRIQQEN